MISVIICTYNRCRSLRRTLQSLEEMSAPPDLRWELVVVDNNSRDETRAVVEDFTRSSGLTVRYALEARQGLSHARNAGIREARGDILSFIDDDVTVDQHWLQHVQSTFDQTGCTGVGGRIVPVWSSPKPPWFAESGPYRLMGVIVSFDLGEERRQLEDAPFGANMSFRRAAFSEHGLFRTDLGRAGTTLIGLEDTEFGRRLLRGNAKLMYDPRAIVYHPVEEGRLRKRYFQSWYFNYGRALIRMNGVPDDTPCYFGVPRHLLRSLLSRLCRGLVAFNSQRLFYHKLHIYNLLGQIAEAYARRPSGP